MQRRRRLRKGGYSSTYLTLKKELREANLQSLGGSSTFIPSSNIDSDPLLSSFMFKPPSAIPITEGDSVAQVSPKDTSKRYNSILYSQKNVSLPFVFSQCLFLSFLYSKIQQESFSNEDQEKAKKSKFVRGLLWSTMLEDKF